MIFFICFSSNGVSYRLPWRRFAIFFVEGSTTRRFRLINHDEQHGDSLKNETLIDISKEGRAKLYLSIEYWIPVNYPKSKLSSGISIDNVHSTSPCSVSSAQQSSLQIWQFKVFLILSAPSAT